MNEYKYIREQVEIRDSYRNSVISLEEGIDKLIAIGYSWEEAKKFLTKNNRGDISMNRNNLDIAMLITDAILNQFERNGKVNIPLDEHKYSFPLQDRIQIELEKIANEDMINDNTKSIGE